MTFPFLFPLFLLSARPWVAVVALAAALSAWGPRLSAEEGSGETFPADLLVETDVVYGHKDGLALTLDVIRPKEDANGAAVLLIQSGGWYSAWRPVRRLIPASRELLDAGFAVVIVRHGSAPRYAVPDAVEDVRRSVRFLRLHGKKRFGIDPDRLGVTGASAGGHLTLMLATTGDDGDPGAEDPVLRESSRIAAGVAVMPPVDLRGWTTDPPEAIAKIPQLAPPLEFDAGKEAGLSPVLHATPDDAPVLLIHGDGDKLVPISHSEEMLKALESGGVERDFRPIEGAGHGFNREQRRILESERLRWFRKWLAVPAGG